MKKLFGLLALALSASAFAAVPRVSDVTLRQDAKHRAVVTYRLAEAPGIVTFDILVDGTSIGASVLTNATGDVNRLVPPTEGDAVRTIVWEPWTTWPGHKLAGGVSARVTVWPTNAPPDFLAMDLTKADCPVTYYASEAALPWGKVWQNPVYKGDVLLMRRIHASHEIAFMGSPETEANRVAGRETRRMCTLTNDYYLAIYPTTLRHHALLRDGAAATETRLSPAIDLSYNMLRYAAGNNNNTALPINFPGTTHRTQVGGSSLLRTFRNRTGLELDLPTSAQWEFACRAGSDTPIYTHPTVSDGTMANLNYIAASYGEVGRMGCNNWYLYDMLGNVYEWCLDYFEDQITADAVVDPLGPLSEPSIRRKIRGYHDQRIHWRSSFFSASAHLTKQTVIGYRLCITLP